jgi:hypothetical protein
VALIQQFVYQLVFVIPSNCLLKALVFEIPFCRLVFEIPKKCLKSSWYEFYANVCGYNDWKPFQSCLLHSTRRGPRRGPRRRAGCPHQGVSVRGPARVGECTLGRGREGQWELQGGGHPYIIVCMVDLTFTDFMTLQLHASGE